MRLKVAYPGTEGSFSCSAARKVFPEAELTGYPTFPQAAQACVDGMVDYCLLPVENSFAGAVLATYQLLEKLPLHIVAETTKPVRHQLLGLPGSRLEDLRQIASHPQAIAQCDAFLQKLPWVQIVPSANTAISARQVMEAGDPTRAAIASTEAAAAYHLEVLAANIQTSRHNTTRFFVLSRKETPLGDPNKATVIFTVNNEVGALVKVLSSFSESGLNMSHIESRPIPDAAFLYFFVADFDGIMDFSHLNQAMAAAAPSTQSLRLLGAYPKALREDET